MQFGQTGNIQRHIYEKHHSMQSNMSDIKAGATANILRLNDNKTIIMSVTLKRTKHLHNSLASVSIGNAQVQLKYFVMILGYTLQCNLTTNEHVSTIACT